MVQSCVVFLVWFLKYSCVSFRCKKSDSVTHTHRYIYICVYICIYIHTHTNTCIYIPEFLCCTLKTNTPILSKIKIKKKDPHKSGAFVNMP